MQGKLITYPVFFKQLQKGANMWVISHHYSINLDNCFYYTSRTTYHGEKETVFRMIDGSEITVSCDYDIVRKQITDAMSVPNLFTVILNY